MNRRHSALTDWGLQHASIGKRDTILDVGCGGGMTVHKLAGMATEGKVYGIDYSETSVATSTETNKKWIAMGRVEIRQGSVSQLPFADQMFDVVTAVETHYFWPDLLGDLREVLRVLKPGGALLLIAEAYKGGKFDKAVQNFAELAKTMNYALLSVGEHAELFAQAGYGDVQVFEEYEKVWICGIGRKHPTED
jgi:ubiquinone/menaquinone biosynthesis C-methylase UbiE